MLRLSWWILFLPMVLAGVMALSILVGVIPGFARYGVDGVGPIDVRLFLLYGLVFSIAFRFGAGNWALAKSRGTHEPWLLVCLVLQGCTLFALVPLVHNPAVFTVLFAGLLLVNGLWNLIRALRDGLAAFEETKRPVADATMAATRDRFHHCMVWGINNLIAATSCLALVPLAERQGWFTWLVISIGFLNSFVDLVMTRPVYVWASRQKHARGLMVFFSRIFGLDGA